MKVYKPSRKSDAWDRIISLYSRGELIIGSFALFIGGFYYRVTNDLSLVVVGGVLVLLSLWHFVVDVEHEDGRSKYDTDRLYVRLKRQLPDGYSLGFDVPVDGKLVDYVVVGDPGVFLVHRLEERGELNGQRTDDHWTVIEEENGSRQINNPFELHRSTAGTVESWLEDGMDRDVPVYNVVVLMYRNVEGSILEIPAVCRLGEVSAYVASKEDDTAEGWTLEESRAIEDVLGLTDYEKP